MEQSKVIRLPEALGGTIFRKGSGDRFSYPLHQHDSFSELLLVTEGAGEFVVDGVRYRAEEGTLLIYNRGAWHEEQSTSETFAAHYLCYHGLQLDGMPPDCLTGAGQPAAITTSEHYLPIRELFHDIIAEWNSRLPESAVIASSLLGQLIGRLVRLLHYTEEDIVRKRPVKEVVYRAKRFIEENYRTDVNLTALARLSHMNPYHFIHVFKQETGVSPIQYLIACRLEVAKRYLTKSNKSMADIAEAIGYKSETYFHNLFKRATGVPPGKYRADSRSGGTELP